MATISSGNDSGLSCVDDTNSVSDSGDSDLDAVMLEASQRFEESIMAEEKHCDYADGGDSDLDALMLEASQRYEESIRPEEKRCDDTGFTLDVGSSHSGLDPLMEASQWYKESILSKKDDVFEENRFAFVTDKDIINEVEGAVPEKTKKQTRWCYNVFTSWRESRLRRATCEAEKPPELCKMTQAELCLWLPRFIFEIRKENGADYSEVSVYNIFCGIQRYIRQNGNPELDFFADSSFASVRSALDSKLKLLRKSGGGITNPSDIISIEEEELLWSKGLLGEHSPDVL